MPVHTQSPHTMRVNTSYCKEQHKLQLMCQASLEHLKACCFFPGGLPGLTLYPAALVVPKGLPGLVLNPAALVVPRGLPVLVRYPADLVVPEGRPRLPDRLRFFFFFSSSFISMLLPLVVCKCVSFNGSCL